MSTSRTRGTAAGPLGSLYNLGAAGDLTDAQLLERFLDRDDPAAAEAAFNALMDRHGAMVLSVCRRELGDLDDAHDAFQATFLVLVNRASTIRHRESVGGWLFGIARRVSARARVEGARRRRHLKRVGTERALPTSDSQAAPVPCAPDDSPLIEEVGRLPERFRAPVVLYYFEGLSTHATAQRLGCPRGTVLSRLSRARDRLRRRLERRGAAPAILIPAGDNLTRWLTTESVPAWLLHATVRAAGSLRLAGAAIESVVPAKVAGLSRQVGRALALSRVGVAGSLVLLSVVVVSLGLAAMADPGARPQAGQVMEKPRGAAEATAAPGGGRGERDRPLVVRGRVIDPAGKPVPGARILGELPGTGTPDTSGIRSVGAAGRDGRFEVSIRRPAHDSFGATGMVEAPPKTVIAATAAGLGPDWLPVTAGDADRPITLRLRPDDIPIEGRIVNLEGRPVPGLNVALEGLSDFPPELLEELRTNGGRVEFKRWPRIEYGLYPSKGELSAAIRTDSDGRFRMTGVGRDRAVVLRIDGGGIERTSALALTTGDRGFRPISLEGRFLGARKIDGPRLTVSVAPGRVIEGVVRDRDTGRPIAGARVNDWYGGNLVTDGRGRFRFEGQPRNGTDRLSASVEGQPYVECFTKIGPTGGLESIELEMALKRGSWVEGRVTDRSTGRPVRAMVGYYPASDNPHVKDYPGALFLEASAPHLPVIPTDADGRFRAGLPPGRGLLSVRANAPGYVAADPSGPQSAGKFINPLGFGGDFMTYNAFVPIDVPVDGRVVVPDIVITPGRTQHLRVVDPDGHPVTETWGYGLQGGSSSGERVAAAEVPFIHANPGKAQTFAFVHEGRSLGGSVDLKGDESDPVQVVLKAAGTIAGRLVDEDGRPRPGVGLTIRHVLHHRGSKVHAEQGGPVLTGPDGRFRIKDLIPGMTYGVTIEGRNPADAAMREPGYLGSPRFTLNPGDVVDWGDVQVRSYGR